MTSENEDFTPAAERLKALPEPPVEAFKEAAIENRRNRLFLILVSMALAIAVIALATFWGGREDAAERANRNASAAAEAQAMASTAVGNTEKLQTGLDEANRQLRALGKPAVSVPTVPVTVPPVPPVVVEGLSSSQTQAVRAIVSAQLASYQIPAPVVAQIAAAAAAMVPKPKDGHTPTAAEIKPLAAAAAQAALLSYCADGKCSPKPGPGGPSGPAGPSGAPGQPGQDAPAVTDAQLRPIVAEAFTAYCNQESRPCDGQKGEQGDPGKDGEMGRGIVSMLCPNDNDVLTADPWVIRWTKDPVQTEGGVCRAAGIP